MILDRIPHDWLALGFLGQAMFSGRFLVQWIASERKRRSVVPTAFWWLSLAGGGALLAYAIHRGDPVFIVGQAAGLVVYVRNLVLIRRGRPVVSASPDPSERSTPIGS
ncbi:MAG TPA: lipid-A-disaccharide synthase N-terminal domain-containing protein [Candidatus Polarisedimenticolaceae bacterium]